MRPAVYPVTDPETGQRTADLKKPHRQALASADEVLMAVHICTPDSEEGKLAKEAADRIQQILVLYKAAPEAPKTSEKKKNPTKDMFEDAEV